jgi:hypothetical protein
VPFPLAAVLLVCDAMATALVYEPEVISQATQTEDDWDQVKAVVKQLVEALRPPAPQPPAAKPVSLIRCPDFKYPGT